jgi:HPt (histidine-containing phosphotransfer) domain-containing protein
MSATRKLRNALEAALRELERSGQIGDALPMLAGTLESAGFVDLSNRCMKVQMLLRDREAAMEASRWA